MPTARIHLSNVFRLVAMLVTLVSLVGCGGRPAGRVSAEPASSPTYGPAVITEREFAKTFTYPIAGELSFQLDPTKHPAGTLDVSGCAVQRLKRLSPNGPSAYPVGFVVNAASECTARTGNFYVKIKTVIVE